MSTQVRVTRSPYWRSSYFGSNFYGPNYIGSWAGSNTDLPTIIANLTDLFVQRGRPSAGSNSGLISVERSNGKAVQILEYEPDPVTFREQHYYNSKLNSLYRKIVTVRDPKAGKIVAHWQKISTPR